MSSPDIQTTTPTSGQEIVLIGGHGRVALLAAPLLTAAGHRVRSVVRNPEHTSEVAATGAAPVVADIAALDAAGMQELFAGADVIVWSAGAGGGSAERTYAVDRDAAIASMAAAEAVGARRYVMVSYFGAGPDHGVDPTDGFHAYAEAKAAADAQLRASALDWTILMPSTLTNEPPRGQITTDETESGQVSRGDVAQTIVTAIDAPTTIGREFRYNSGQTPITDAIR